MIPNDYDEDGYSLGDMSGTWQDDLFVVQGEADGSVNINGDASFYEGYIFTAAP